MKPADLEILNRRQRMTPEERNADIAREIWGPVLDRLFPDIAPPKVDETDEGEAA